MSTVKSKKLQVGTDATATNNFTIYQPASPDGTLRIGVGNADSPTEVGRFDSNGLNKLGTATGDAPSYSARAWVNFNGTGTVAIRDSGNVSSITDSGTGTYRINFATAMPDANYAMNAFCIFNTTVPAGNVTYGSDYSQLVGSVTIKSTVQSSNGLFDSAYVLASIFR